MRKSMWRKLPGHIVGRHGDAGARLHGLGSEQGENRARRPDRRLQEIAQRQAQSRACQAAEQVKAAGMRRRPNMGSRPPPTM